MYDAEIALHAAHQSHVGAWITAAADRLHEAIVEHTAAVQTAGRVLTEPRESKHATSLVSSGSVEQACRQESPDQRQLHRINCRVASGRAGRSHHRLPIPLLPRRHSKRQCVRPLPGALRTDLTPPHRPRSRRRRSQDGSRQTAATPDALNRDAGVLDFRGPPVNVGARTVDTVAIVGVKAADARGAAGGTNDPIPRWPGTGLVVSVAGARWPSAAEWQNGLIEPGPPALFVCLPGCASADRGHPRARPGTVGG